MRRLRRQAFEHGLGQVEFFSCRKSGKTKFTTSCRSRVISMSMKDSMVSTVKCFILSTFIPDNITVVRRGKNLRLEIEKERLSEEPRKVTKEIEATGDLVTNHINVARPGEGVVHYDPQKLPCPYHQSSTPFHC